MKNGWKCLMLAVMGLVAGLVLPAAHATPASRATTVLILGSDSRTFTADAANNKELAVTANVSWTAKSSASWLVVKTTSGKGNGKIVYNVAANTGNASRTAKITVSGGGKTATFTATQSGKSGGTTATLTLSATSRTFTADAANSKELGVTANVSWTAKSSASWLVVKTTSGKGNGKIVYNVAANTASASRTAKITVTGGGKTATFTATQSGKSGGTTTTLTLSSTSRTFTADAANNKELGVTANVSWTAKSSVSWLVVKTASGSGNGKIVYNVAANAGSASRTGKITVTGGGKTGTFTVTQSGKSGGTTATLELGASSRSFNANAANNKELKVTANVAWTAKSNGAWLTVKTTSGNGNGTIVYNVAANPTLTSRSATVTVSGGGLTRTFAVTQSGLGLFVVVDLSAGANASKYPVTSLDAAPSQGWTDEYKTTKLVLRRIDAGAFDMNGSVRTTLSDPYYIGVFEMTQKQYQLVTGNNPSYHKGDKRPVELVSYDYIRGTSEGTQWPANNGVDSGSFLGKLRSRTGMTFELPTEAQWEYACRAGTTSAYNNGSNSTNAMNTLGRHHYNKNDGKGGYSEHTTVGSYQPNAWGLYDMHGNVFEWCLDWYGNLAGGTNPKGPSSGTGRVIRGGGWIVDPVNCTSSYRFDPDPGHATRPAGDGYGFRLALIIPQPVPRARSARGAAVETPAGTNPQSVLTENGRVWVTTSDNTDASAVVDGDESTAWSPSTPAPSWLALTFETPRPVEAVEVLGENLPAGMRALLSPDANTWSEEGSDSVSYLWLLLPAEGPLPVLREISTLP